MLDLGQEETNIFCVCLFFFSCFFALPETMSLSKHTSFLGLKKQTKPKTLKIPNKEKISHKQTNQNHTIKQLFQKICMSVNKYYLSK